MGPHHHKPSCLFSLHCFVTILPVCCGVLKSSDLMCPGCAQAGQRVAAGPQGPFVLWGVIHGLGRNDEYRCPAGRLAIYRFTTEEAGKTLHKYWSSDCPRCPMKPRCTRGPNRRISRWEHEEILDVGQQRLEGVPEAMKLRRQTVEHVFGTLKA